MWQFESNTRETLNEMFIFACRERGKRYVHTHRELMNICLRISKLNNNDVVNCVKNFETFVFTQHKKSLAIEIQYLVSKFEEVAMFELQIKQKFETLQLKVLSSSFLLR